MEGALSPAIVEWEVGVVPTHFLSRLIHVTRCIWKPIRDILQN